MSKKLIFVFIILVIVSFYVESSIDLHTRPDNQGVFFNNRLNLKANVLRTDTLEHLFASTLLTLWIYEFSITRLELDSARARDFAPLMVFNLGLLKEVSDSFKGGEFSMYDLAADLTGTLLGYLIIRYSRYS